MRKGRGSENSLFVSAWWRLFKSHLNCLCGMESFVRETFARTPNPGEILIIQHLVQKFRDFIGIYKSRHLVLENQCFCGCLRCVNSPTTAWKNLSSLTLGAFGCQNCGISGFKNAIFIFTIYFYYIFLTILFFSLSPIASICTYMFILYLVIYFHITSIPILTSIVPTLTVSLLFLSPKKLYHPIF